MKNLVVITVCFIMLILSNKSFAQGIYLGGGIGSNFFSTEAKDTLNQLKDISESSVAWKIFGGYHLTDFLNIEGGYRSFESISSTFADNVYESKTTGWDIEALGRFQLLILDVFGKAGMMFWSTDKSFLGESTSNSGSDFLWGLGVGIHLGPLGVRLEWESIAMSGPTSLSMLSLGATFGF